MSVILLTGVHLAIHIPAVQNYIAHKITSAINPKLDGKLSFSKLTISFVNTVIVEDFSITGTPGDTLVSAEKVALYVSPKDVFKGNFKANRISIKNGVFNYIEEGPNKESNLDRIFRITKKGEKKEKGGWPTITINELRIQNYRFNYKDFRPPKHPVYPGGMDYTDIGVYEINLRAYDVQTRPKKGVTAKIHSLKAKEKSSLVLKDLSCDFSLDKHATTLKNLRLQEGFSYVKANYLTFGYRSGKDLKGFVRNINMDVDFTDTFLDFRTIGIYTPYMQNNTLQLYLNGRIHGPVTHLQSDRLRIETPSKKTHIDLAISIKGLPSIRKTVFDAQIFNLKSVSEETDRIISHFARKNKTILSKYLSNAKFSLKGNMLGSIYGFKADGAFSSTVGDIVFDVSSDIKGKKEGSAINGKVTTHDVDLGKILKVSNLGKISADAKADVTIKGAEYGGLNINLKSLSINKLGFKGYNYSNIMAVGEYSNKSFDGKIISHDPNLDLMFQGIATLSDLSKKSIYNFYADIPYIDLKALNLIKSDKKAQLSLRTMANVSSQGDELIGNVDIKNITYWGDKEYKFNAITLSSILQKENYKIDFDAPFIQARYKSDESPGQFITRVKDRILTRQFGNTFIRNISKDTIGPLPGKNTDIHIRTFDTEDIFNILMPEVYLSDNTSIDINVNDRDSINLHITSDRIALGKNSLKDLDMNLHTCDSIIRSDINSSLVTIGGVELKENFIGLEADKGVIQLHCQLDTIPTNGNSATLNSAITFERMDGDNKLKTNILMGKSHLRFKGHNWDIDTSAISIAKRYFEFDKFSLSDQEQFIMIDGILSESPDDSIKAILKEFDISIANTLLNSKINLNGILNGDITASNIYQEPSILMDMKGSGISIMTRTIGDLSMMSKWDRNHRRMNILVQNHNEGMTPLSAVGYYQPNGKYVNIQLSLKELGLGFVEPLVKGALINTGGVISGNMELVGTLNKLNLNSSNTRIHNFSFTPAYTNVPYVVSGDLEFNNSGIYFDRLDVHDKFNNKGTLSGSLRHSSFRNMYLDASLGFEDLQCLNTTEKDNDTFYGTAFATGNISLTGPFKDLYADVTATTNARTAIHIPLSSSASAKGGEILEFTSDKTIQSDPYIERLNRRLKEKNREIQSKTNFTLKAKANVTSDAELFIEINKQLGDILKCRGNGSVDINLDPSKSLLDLKGDYTIEEGSYKFVLLGITAKDFIIDNGGSINFNGNIKSTTLNVGATYQTKASVSTLIADTSAVGNRRTVDCGIGLSGSLSDPNISFSVDVKDLDPITKGRVESALSTDDKVQKQFMALILSGSFIPDEQSGIFNNSTILYSNAGEMLSNQVNNVFRQLDIPLDLGFNYQPAADGKTHDMFDVALSYQAFNNRVIINGNVGNNQVSQSWGGDFEAEVKLDKQGKMRLKAFTRSPDDYSNYLDNSQRHGVGFTYQDEFDTFRELLRNIFWSKKRKEAYETQKIMEAERDITQEQKAQ